MPENDITYKLNNYGQILNANKQGTIRSQNE